MLWLLFGSDFERALTYVTFVILRIHLRSFQVVVCCVTVMLHDRVYVVRFLRGQVCRLPCVIITQNATNITSESLRKLVNTFTYDKALPQGYMVNDKENPRSNKPDNALRGGSLRNSFCASLNRVSGLNFLGSALQACA